MLIHCVGGSAADHEELDVASRHPTARLGTIEVRPFLEG